MAACPGGPLPVSFVAVAPPVGPLPVSPFVCANARADGLSAIAHAGKLLVLEDMNVSFKRRQHQNAV
jgi:hypothetical protein